MSFFSDDILMQYAAGELGESSRHALEMAMRHDPALAARVKQHQMLRANVFSAYAQSLDEELPQRLQAATRSGKVVHLNAARSARMLPPRLEAPPTPGWTWREWSAIGAAALAGLALGAAALHSIQGDSQTAVAASSGALVANGALERALTQQASGAARGLAVMGSSFISKEGGYCRSFTLPAAVGLACRSAAGWDIPALVKREAGVSQAMPPALQQAINLRMAGQPLDAEGERLALQQGWLR